MAAHSRLRHGVVDARVRERAHGVSARRLSLGSNTGFLFSSTLDRLSQNPPKVSKIIPQR